jgi:hypothetical protein
VLTPEERHDEDFLAASEHVECGGLALSLSDHPVFDADVFAAVRIGPARDVAGREDSGISRYSGCTHLPRRLSGPPLE